MATKPQDVARLTPPTGTIWDIARNRDVTTGAGKLTAADVTISTDRLGVWRQWDMVAGWPVDHGEVADQAAMLALHTFGHSALTQPLPRYVAPGDSCTRTDDPGWRWHCLRGHGTMLTDWERRPLSGALTGLSASGHTHSLLSLTEVVTALDGKQGALSNAAALARITAEAGGLPKWDGGDWPGGGSSGGPVLGPLMSRPFVRLWFGADSAPRDSAGVPASSGVCRVWRDQSMYASTALADSGYYPSIVTDLAGRPGIRSSAGTSQNLRLPDTSLFPSGLIGDFTIFARVQISAGSSGYALVFGATTSGRLSVFVDVAADRVIGLALGASTEIRFAGYAVDATPHLIEIWVRSTVATLYADGVMIGSSASPAVLADAAWTPRIGCYAPGLLDQGCTVDVYAVVLLDGSASDIDCAAVRASLI